MFVKWIPCQALNISCHRPSISRVRRFPPILLQSFISHYLSKAVRKHWEDGVKSKKHFASLIQVVQGMPIRTTDLRTRESKVHYRTEYDICMSYRAIHLNFPSLTWKNSCLAQDKQSWTCTLDTINRSSLYWSIEPHTTRRTTTNCSIAERNRLLS